MRNRLILAVVLLLLLCGCSPYSVESLFVPPQVPEEYAQLNAQLNEVRLTGAEYISPSSGSNRQAVQLFDLDTDGEDECVVFFRNSAQKDEVQLYLYEYTDGKFWLHSVVDGLSSAIESVEFADVLGKGNHEIIVTWDRSGEKILGVYEKSEESFGMLYEMPFEYYVISDLNEDGVGDLNIIHSNPGENAKLTMHTAQNGMLVPLAQATLSGTGATVDRMGTGRTESGSALFVTLKKEDGFTTDVFGIQERVLKNMSQDASIFCKYPIYFTDLDGDGCVEVPHSEHDPMKPETTFWELTWYGYNANGVSYEKLYTYHSSEQNWYLSLPLSWKGKVVAEYDTTNAAMTKAIFYSDAYQPLFTFAAISGEKRTTLLEEAGMVQIAELDNTVYAVKIEQEEYLGEVLTQEWLSGCFHRRDNTWAVANLIVK